MTRLADRLRRRPTGASLTRSRAYTFAVASVAAIIVLQMLTSFVGMVVAGRQFERASIDTFEYVGELTVERVSRFTEAARHATTATASELELVGTDVDRDALERSLFQRLASAGAVRAVYVGWSDGEFMVVRRDGDTFLSQRGGGEFGPEVTSRVYDSSFVLLSREVSDSDYDPRTRPWYHTGVGSTTRERWSPPFVDYFDGAALVSATRAVREDGEVAAVVGADLNLDELAGVLDGLPYGEGAEAFVLTQQLDIVAAPTSYADDVAALSGASGEVPQASDIGLYVDPESVGPMTERFSREDDRVVLDRGFPVAQTIPWRLHVRASDEELSAGLGALGSMVLWFNVGSLVMVLIAAIVLWWMRHPLGRLRERAMTDPLTKLLNRHEFYRRGRLVARRAVDRGDVVMVTVLDLDRFKQLNDELGHGVGDQCLAAVAAALTGSARAGDLAARTGGDEFAMLHVLRPGVNALHVVQRVRDAVEHEIHTRIPEADGVGVTAGYATAGIGVGDLDLLIAHADQALVAGKKVEKGRVYSSEEAASAFERRRASGGIGEPADPSR
ncbi:diguanylate cyclase [Demequina sp. SO4-18]|uniref:GGDEF domain-containing protein n=1 Tax=Demequina sp. SO4-18 TaxID=3401026 RepID=UPI003B59E16D